MFWGLFRGALGPIWGCFAVFSISIALDILHDKNTKISELTRWAHGADLPQALVRWMRVGLVRWMCMPCPNEKNETKQTRKNNLEIKVGGNQKATQIIKRNLF